MRRRARRASGARRGGGRVLRRRRGVDERDEVRAGVGIARGERLPAGTAPRGRDWRTDSENGEARPGCAVVVAPMGDRRSLVAMGSAPSGRSRPVRGSAGVHPILALLAGAGDTPGTWKLAGRRH